MIKIALSNRNIICQQLINNSLPLLGFLGATIGAAHRNDKLKY